MSTAGTLQAPTFSGNVNYGSATPIKWQLQDSAGNYLTDLATTQILKAVAYTGGACSGQATGQSYLLYEPDDRSDGREHVPRRATSQFIFNWDTSSSSGPGCYELVLQLNDGSAIRATIQKLQ